MNSEYSIAWSILNNEEAAFKYAVRKNIIKAPPDLCDKCLTPNSYALVRINSNGRINRTWRCRQCQKKITAKRGSVFWNAKVSCCEVFRLFWLFQTGLSDTAIVAQTAHDNHTVGAWRVYYNDAITRKVAQDTEIGGLDENGFPIEVEIDESKFGSRKYNRGHRVEGV